MPFFCAALLATRSLLGQTDAPSSGAAPEDDRAKRLQFLKARVPGLRPLDSNTAESTTTPASKSAEKPIAASKPRSTPALAPKSLATKDSASKTPPAKDSPPKTATAKTETTAKPASSEKSTATTGTASKTAKTEKPSATPPAKTKTTASTTAPTSESSRPKETAASTTSGAKAKADAAAEPAKKIASTEKPSATSSTAKASTKPQPTPPAKVASIEKPSATGTSKAATTKPQPTPPAKVVSTEKTSTTSSAKTAATKPQPTPSTKAASTERPSTAGTAKAATAKSTASTTAAGKPAPSVASSTPDLKKPATESLGRSTATSESLESLRLTNNRPHSRYPWKTNIVTTVFWVGERPSGNNFTPNYASSWDMAWSRSYGGYDNPDPDHRRNFIPVAFKPRQNNFYVALPYNDVTRGTTKPEARRVIPWFRDAFEREGQSVCHNRWVAIRNREGRIAYAQWSDCGPFRTDHWQYVFGSERPKPNLNKGAGLDVSPAVRDFLGLRGTDVTDWRFVDVNEVPHGPWAIHGDNNTCRRDVRRMTRHSAELRDGRTSNLADAH